MPLAGLEGRADSPAVSLSHGERRLVGIVRTLAARPGFILLDEPAAGLNERDGDRLIEFIREAQADMGSGILLVEHDMRLLMGFSERVHVLDFGRTIRVGTPAEVSQDAEVINAYLGSPA
jgi:branched-chain amino acid transport system ATP-binding protein